MDPIGTHIQAERIVLAELVRDRAWRLSGPTGRGKPVGVGSFCHYFTGFQVDMVNISHSLQTWFKNIPFFFFFGFLEKINSWWRWMLVGEGGWAKINRSFGRMIGFEITHLSLGNSYLYFSNKVGWFSPRRFVICFEVLLSLIIWNGNWKLST